ncbi:MAG: hypothetical protein ACFFCQ_00170 [Promethearchaeota archaeon]
MNSSSNEDVEIAVIISAFDEKKGPVPLAMTENWTEILSEDQLLNLVMWAEVSVGAFDRRAGLGARERRLQGPLQIPVQPTRVGLIWPWMTPAPESTRLKRGRLHCLILVFPEMLTERLLEKIPEMQEYLLNNITIEKRISQSELDNHTNKIREIVLEEEDYVKRALKVAFRSTSPKNDKNKMNEQQSDKL